MKKGSSTFTYGANFISDASIEGDLTLEQRLVALNDLINTKQSHFVRDFDLAQADGRRYDTFEEELRIGAAERRCVKACGYIRAYKKHNKLLVLAKECVNEVMAQFHSLLAERVQSNRRAPETEEQRQHLDRLIDSTVVNFQQLMSITETLDYHSWINVRQLNTLLRPSPGSSSPASSDFDALVYLTSSEPSPNADD